MRSRVRVRCIDGSFRAKVLQLSAGCGISAGRSCGSLFTVYPIQRIVHAAPFTTGCRRRYRLSADSRMESVMISSPPRGSHPFSLTACLLLVLAPLFWAGNVVLARGVADQIPPVTMAFLRWSGAFLFLIPFTWKHVRRDWLPLRAGWRHLLPASLFGIASFNTLLYTATQTTTAINCALMQTVMPAAIILCCFLLYGERISLLQGCGVLLCSAGAGWIVLHGELARLAGLQLLRGDLLMLIAVFCYALYSALLRRRPEVHPLSYLTVTIGLGTLLLVPLFCWEIGRVAAPAVSPTVVGSILYIALFPSIAAYLCWNRGIDLLGPNRAGLFINLIPVFAAGMAMLFLGERLHSYHLVGLLLVAVGMVLFQVQAHRQPPSAGRSSR
ncbi:EamA family transporter [Geothermobacter hydrogeniphilus]|uniref:EamA family transporter n=2 Tax=Geothermobacter hydrogeniphilus TaxID=1969733 RepID=A0A2K2HA53_9BACT|nr:EamA family transporter [Geothermobacter hydrogeniphilus]